MKKINHLWRILATGICFGYFGLGGLCLTLFVFPLQKIFVQNKPKQKQLARTTVHHTFKWFISFMASVGVFKFDLESALKLKDLQGHLILANHPSLIDVVVLISIIPNADCVVKAHLFKNPFIRGVVKNTGYISNADPEGLLLDCKATLAAGNNLIIFPEGTRSQPGKKLKFQRGAANIALRCQANIAYVLIDVCPPSLTKSVAWYKVPECKAKFTATLFSPPIILPEYNEATISKDVRIFNKELEDFFNQKQ